MNLVPSYMESNSTGRSAEMFVGQIAFHFSPTTTYDKTWPFPPKTTPNVTDAGARRTACGEGELGRLYDTFRANPAGGGL